MYFKSCVIIIGLIIILVKLENLKNSLAAIRHARWFEENAYQSSIRILVRILKDFKNRIPFFKHVSPWTIDLLVRVYCPFCV